MLHSFFDKLGFIFKALYVSGFNILTTPRTLQILGLAFLAFVNGYIAITLTQIFKPSHYNTNQLFHKLSRLTEFLDLEPLYLKLNHHTKSIS